MILKTFLDHATKILKIVEKHRELFQFIEKIASFESTYNDYYKQLRKSYNSNASVSNQQMTPIINQLRKQDGQTLTEIRKYRPFDLFSNLSSLISELNEIEIFYKDLEGFLESDIQKLINLHTDAYSERNFHEIYSFVSYCNIFLAKIEKFTYVSEVSIRNLKLEPKEVPPKNQIIEIIIVSQLNDLEKFSSFLSFIDVLYQDLCKASAIHYNDYPLNIIKIESGSIWTKLFGQQDLIQLIKDLIMGLCSYVRDLQTGKINREIFENKVKKADLVADLILKANEIGVADDKKVLLEKAFGRAIADFTRLLPKTTTEIILDDKPLMTLNKEEIKAILGSQKLMLNGKKDDENEKPSA